MDSGSGHASIHSKKVNSITSHSCAVITKRWRWTVLTVATVQFYTIIITLHSVYCSWSNPKHIRRVRTRSERCRVLKLFWVQSFVHWSDCLCDTIQLSQLTCIWFHYFLHGTQIFGIEQNCWTFGWKKHNKRASRFFRHLFKVGYFTLTSFCVPQTK